MMATLTSPKKGVGMEEKNHGRKVNYKISWLVYMANTKKCGNIKILQPNDAVHLYSQIKNVVIGSHYYCI